MARKRMMVMAVFDHLRDAEHAIAGLKSMGIGADEISVLAHPDSLPSSRVNIAVAKNGVGMTTAGLTVTLIGIALCAVPLAGLLTAAPLILAGGLASVATGHRPVDDLRELGVPKEDAELAIENARRGSISVFALVERSQARRIAEIMARAGAIDFHDRAAKWEERGWEYEPNAPAYTHAELFRERHAQDAYAGY